MTDDNDFKTVTEVAYRALALIALTIRVTADSLARTDPDQNDRWNVVVAKVRSWVAEQGIDPHLSAVERAAIAQPLGRIDDDTLFDLSWRLQALVALLWALHQIEPMPTYAESYAADALQPLLPFGQPVADFLAKARLRTEEELVTERHRAEFWNWRGQTEVRRRGGKLPQGGDSDDAAITQAAQTALDEGVVTEVIDGDVICLGQPYRALSSEGFAEAASTAQERDFALSWICGSTEDWDETETEV